MKKTLLLPACGLAMCLTTATSAQQQPSPQAQQQQGAPTGLDALSDDRLMTELANRGLEPLLERAFVVNKVPREKQEGIRTLIALRELSDPHARLTARERQERIGKIVGGIEQALPGMNDPRVLMQQASVLIKHGVERDVNTLEYWGENPRTQAALRPVAQVVVKLLEKAAAVAEKQAETVANQLKGLDDPRAALAEELSNLAISAAYTKAMSDYYVALSIDRADAKRKQIATAAIDALAEFDTPETEVQPIVRNRMAKLHMAAGNYSQARELFRSVADGTDVKPPPDVAMQYEARYFAAVCDVLARKPDEAAKALNDLLAWQKTALPPAAEKGAAAAAAMLEYRIQSLRASLAQSESQKNAANEKAVQVLLELVRERPELQGIIFEQIAGRLPENPDVKSLDPLLLQALVRKGEDERLKPENQPFDKAVVERAIDAARELVARQGQGGIDAQTAENALLAIAVFLDKLDRDAEAALAFLDFARQYPTSARAKLALDNAQSLVARLRKEATDDPGTIKAYETFLEVAINPPFNRTEFAFEWARRLQLNGRYRDAVEYYRKVPKDDKRKLSARFYDMVALQQQLDTPSTAVADRPRLVSEIQQLANEVRSGAEAKLAGAPNDEERTAARSLLVRTTLLAADVARREQKDPKRTLELLADFEKQAEGLPNQQDLVGSVLFARVQSHMALGQNTEATDTLVRLLKTMPGGEGAAIVFNLLEKLNADLDKARAAGDIEQMKVLASNRAQLSGFLVDWARNNPDENIRKFTYRYSVFDAATKHLAADLESDPAARKKGLEKALALYEKLQSEEGVAMYQATLPPTASAADRNAPDPAVALGIGLIAYDLGNYTEAQKRLGQLLTDRKLGTPLVETTEDGERRLIENEKYWEATLKLLRSNVALAGEAQSEARTQSENYLKQLYIRWGDQVGGKKWGPEFQKLRQELIPNFDPNADPDTAAAPTTEPQPASD
ncbi:MAG TPA: hypothetical protein VGR35_17165 [Tepidisphaeraceae bacterium]|nr:hypothetical protein [Tepidisphaeraceae bacterium]